MSERERNRPPSPIESERGDESLPSPVLSNLIREEEPSSITPESQSEQSPPSSKLPDSTTQIADPVLAETSQHPTEPRTFLLATRRPPAKTEIRGLERQMLTPSFTTTEDGRLMDLVLAWFNEDEHFRAQVRLVFNNESLEADQKLDLILDLLDALLDDKRSSSRPGPNHSIYNESLLLLRRYKNTFTSTRLVERIDELLSEMREAKGEMDYLREKNQHLQEQAADYVAQIENVNQGRKVTLASARQNAFLKIVLFLTFFSAAGVLFLCGLFDIASVVLGLALGQLVTEIFDAVSKAYGGE